MTPAKLQQEVERSGSLHAAIAALKGEGRSLRELGNLSSASVLMVLRETLELGDPPGTRGLMISMGPGFCSELALLEW